MAHFAFYGSLRKGEYNWARLLEKESGVQYLGTEIVEGYKMHSFGAYPAICTGTPQDTIVVDIFQIDNPRVAERIHFMETGAGYDMVHKTINDKTCVLYTMEDAGRYSRSVVNGGDWVKFNHPK